MTRTWPEQKFQEVTDGMRAEQEVWATRGEEMNQMNVTS